MRPWQNKVLSCFSIGYIVLLLLFVGILVLTGCGSVRYNVKQPTDGRRVQTEIEWTAIELNFNDFWKKTRSYFGGY